MKIISMKVTPGIYISGEMLKKAGIEQDEVKIEIEKNLIRIVPAAPHKKSTLLSKDSPIWDQVAMDDIGEEEEPEE
jgi:hypothetical protein